MAKLNQIIAIEKGIKSRSYSEFGELHKASQKQELFNGFSKTYQKKNEESEELPPESKRVQFTVVDVLRNGARILTEHFDVTARKDYTNCVAKADVKIDDKVIITNAPVSYLLFLEKQLTDLRTFANCLPVLDPAEDWNWDANTGLYKTNVVQTHRTKKIARPIVLYNATPEHPAQTQLITEDILAGYWNQVKQSGAFPAPDKAKLVERIESLLQAVKQAREEANGFEEVVSPEVGEAVFNFLLEE
jgi:hypothetical protein